MTLGSQFIRKPIWCARGQGRLIWKLIAAACVVLHNEAKESPRILATEQNAVKKNETLNEEVDGLPFQPAVALNEEDDDDAALNGAYSDDAIDEDGVQIGEAIEDIKSHQKGMEKALLDGAGENAKRFNDIKGKAKAYDEAIDTLGTTVMDFGTSLRKVVKSFKIESDKQAELASGPVDIALKALEDSRIPELGSNPSNNDDDGKKEDKEDEEDKESQPDKQLPQSDDTQAEKEIQEEKSQPDKQLPKSDESSSLLEDLAGVSSRLSSSGTASEYTESAVAADDHDGEANVRRGLHDKSKEEMQPGVLLQLQVPSSRKSAKSIKKPTLTLDAGELLLAAENHTSHLQHGTLSSSDAQGPVVSQRSERISFLQSSVPAQQS